MKSYGVTIQMKATEQCFPVVLFILFYKVILLSNSENREHLKNFRNVDCVLANHNKVQDM